MARVITTVLCTIVNRTNSNGNTMHHLYNIATARTHTHTNNESGGQREPLQHHLRLHIKSMQTEDWEGVGGGRSLADYLLL